jgi:TonB family protein
LWLIEHHPESQIAGFNFASLSPSPNLLNDEADYARVKNLWLAQTVLYPKDSRVLANALRFFSQPGSDATARERLLKRAEELAALAPSPSEASSVSSGVAGADAVSGRATSAAPPPPTATPAPAGRPTRILVDGDVQSSHLLTMVKPVYPPLARRARIQGKVRFTVIIGQDGRVQNLQIISGHPLLVPAAQDAVKQWVYRPTLVNDEPVEVVTQVDVNFALSQ